jgi:O-antigen/teichoic acid export membrane protein
MKKRLLTLLSDTFVYGLAGVIQQVIGFLLLPLYTRHLTTEDYGIIAMLAIITPLFGAFGLLGMKSAIFQRFSLAANEAERGSCVTIGTLNVFVGSLVVLIVCLIFAKPLTMVVIGSEASINLVRLTLLSSFLTALGGVPEVLFQADRRIKTTTSINICKMVLTISLTVWLVVFKGQGVFGVVVATLIVEGAGLLVELLLCLPYFGRKLSYTMWRAMMSYGLPFVPYRLFGMATGAVGVYMVSRKLGLAEAGLYNIASKFALPIAFISNAVGMAWWPHKFIIFKEEKDPARVYSSTLIYSTIFMSFLWVGISIWSPEAIRLLTTEQFHAAWVLVPAIALTPIVQWLYQMLGTGIELGDDTRTVPLISLGGFITVTVGALLLIPLFGAMGAAISTVLSSVVMTIAIYLIAQRRFAVRYDWAILIAITLFAFTFVFAAMWWQRFSMMPRLILAFVASIVYPLLLFFILSFSPNERERMNRLRLNLTAYLPRFRSDVLPEEVNYSKH